MSLVDRVFLQQNASGIKISQCKAEVTVRGIRQQIHQCSKHVVITLFIPGKVNGKPALASITHQLHIVDNLQANILIGMDILGPEQAIVNVGRRILTLLLCENLQASLTILPKRARTAGRVVLASKLTTILPNSVAAVPI